MTDAEILLLQTRRATVPSQLAAMTASSVGGKANSAGEESVDHVGYKDGLYRELKEIEALLSTTTFFEFIT